MNVQRVRMVLTWSLNDSARTRMKVTKSPKLRKFFRISGVAIGLYRFRKVNTDTTTAWLVVDWIVILETVPLPSTSKNYCAKHVIVIVLLRSWTSIFISETKPWTAHTFASDDLVLLSSSQKHCKCV